MGFLCVCEFQREKVTELQRQMFPFKWDALEHAAAAQSKNPIFWITIKRISLWLPYFCEHGWFMCVQVSVCVFVRKASRQKSQFVKRFISMHY